MFDVWHIATRESVDFQLTARIFTRSPEIFCLASHEQQAEHTPVNWCSLTEILYPHTGGHLESESRGALEVLRIRLDGYNPTIG